MQVGKAVLCAMLCPRACVHARCRAVGIMWEGSRGGQGGAVCTPRPAARARAPTAQQAQQRADQPTAQQRGPRAKSRPRRPRVRGSGRGPGGPRAHLYSRTLNTSCSALSHTASASSVPSCEKAALQQPPGAVASFLNSALGTCAGGGPCVTRRMRVRVRGGRRSRVWGATSLNHPLPFREVARCVGVCLERCGEVGGGAFRPLPSATSRGGAPKARTQSLWDQPQVRARTHLARLPLRPVVGRVVDGREAMALGLHWGGRHVTGAGQHQPLSHLGGQLGAKPLRAGAWGWGGGEGVRARARTAREGMRARLCP